ncbi:MAG: hypothetical protein JXA69_01645, partial [Phycisphaerae bacterium]|nr:hypothetical protein [Phycisphaerae bacterium]
TFTSDATVGTYTMTCTVTDSVGASVASSIYVMVGNGLSASVTTSRLQVLPGGGANGQATLTASAIGGSGGYTYLWAVTNPAGAGEDARLSATNVQSPTFTSTTTLGTYRITCTVTDSVGMSFSAAVHVQVSAAVMFLDVRADTTVVLPGAVVTLIGDRTGGTANFNYSWRAYDSAGADQGTWGEDDDGGAAGGQQNDEADDVTQTWTAPSTATGTYRIVCTLTDSLSYTYVDSLEVYVPTSTLTLTSPANEDADNTPTSVLGVTTLGSLSTVVQVNTTLTYPRNLKVRCGDPGNSLAGDVWIEISGVSAQGSPQIEHFYFLIPGAGGYVTTEGVKPFARVDTARYVVVTGSASGNETVQIGVGDTFGLPRVIPASSSVRRVLLLPGTTLTTPADYSVITTPGQQGIRFTNPARDPNGANSYEILYDDN